MVLARKINCSRAGLTSVVHSIVDFSDMTDFGKLAKKIHGGVSATIQQARETPPEIIIVRRGNRKGLLGSLGVVRVFVGRLNDRVIYVTVNGQLVGQLDEKETLKVNGCEGVNRIGVGPANKIAVEIDIELELSLIHI